MDIPDLRVKASMTPSFVPALPPPPEAAAPPFLPASIKKRNSLVA
jgi:hypothetical protein